ncbi:hypothetical protein GcM1_224028 [Golovinomyces cichoracearum]|uniref:Uncharacterized protein n=1 Tax=Golovinomyces cichoracearum TaxID=62708 RepID=A0A420IQH9_9PEZI|nr:hypothetical protein GcM1_224028 [Golovinomyces cichoracearum]
MHQGLNLHTSKGMGMCEKASFFSKNPSGSLKTSKRTINKDEYSNRVSRLPKPVIRAWKDSAPQKDNTAQDRRNDLTTHMYLSSRVENVTSEIIPIYDVASQNKDGSNCDTPSIQPSDSKYYFRKNIPPTSPQIHPRDRKIFRCSESNIMYPAGLKQKSLEKPLPALVNLGPFEISHNKEVHGTLNCACRKILLKPSLHSENRIQSKIIRSDGKTSYCPSGHPFSTCIPLNTSNQRIKNRPRSQKIMEKDESLSFNISLTSSSKFASISDLFTKTLTLSSPFSRDLQVRFPNHRNYNEDSNKNECIKEEYFSPFLLPSTANSPLNRENEPSKEFINPSSNFDIMSTATYPVISSSESFLFSTTTGSQKIYRNSAELKSNEANVKPTVDKKARCASGVRDSFDGLCKFPESSFQSSINSSKSLCSKRASHTTIDQIEMELDVKTTDYKSEMFYGRTINRIPSLAFSSYSVPNTLGAVRNLEYERQIDTKYVMNRNSTPNNHNLSEKNDLHERVFASEILPRHPISPSAPNSKLRSNKFTFFRKGFPVLTTEFNSSAKKKVQHGLSTHYQECTSLGDEFIHHGKTHRDSRYDLSSKAAFINLQEDRFCSELDHDQCTRKKEETGPNKKKLLPICDKNATLILNFSHPISSSLGSLSHSSFIAPKTIYPAKQIFESGVPQLMKALPPTPTSYISTEVDPFSRNKDSEISHISSPERVKSEKSSISPDIYENKFPKNFFSTNEDLMKKVELKSNEVHAQESKRSNQFKKMKRSSDRLNFSMKTLPTLSNHSSESVTTLHLASSAKDCVNGVEPISITVLKEHKGLKSQARNLNTPKVQSSCHKTFSIKKLLVSFKSITKLLNSRPEVSLTSRTKSENNSGHFSDDLRSIQEISANNDLNMGENLFTLETKKRKNLKQPSNSPGLLGNKDKSNLMRNLELTSVTSDNELRVEDHRILKKLSHIRCRIASSHVVPWRKSNDERLWGTHCSYNTGKMHSARSVTNSNRKHYISNPILSLKEKLQSQRFRKKFRGSIHSARSSITVHEKSRAKIWRKYKTYLRGGKMVGNI